jgi:hypothetical protein
MVASVPFASGRERIAAVFSPSWGAAERVPASEGTGAGVIVSRKSDRARRESADASSARMSCALRGEGVS